MMTKILKGDFIIHNCNGKIVSISVAKNDCYEANQPHELSAADTTVEWNDKGYRVDTDYYDFDVPAIVTDYRNWLKDNFIEGSAFTRCGTGKQQYMCHLADVHAIFLLGEAIKLQTKPDVISQLQNAITQASCYK